ncbi:thiamine pyrophosphate-binding protein [Actinomadura sp. WMMB 499]|uniref:thiamine pyrophosphate-binding protein n=1 Tax=Actinomadura sp. WMMB 499 TaxID=1219491 RepID=UPI0012452AA9|nr:thiamine pyrophosphate-binding protein [Actinomadura sp. WMMB 499]QFG23601.1 thiamine pyrophosphate-binding protein [Actinomadura sp. WMMB 499]
MSDPNGGDLLVQVLREHGVTTVFGVVSVHNLPLVEAVDRDLRFVAVRHEAAAVNAADAHARASGGLGCALTSTGTGAGNAAGALIEALTAGSRVLHVTGNIDSEYLGQGRGVIHETKDQLGMLAAVSKHAAAVGSAASAGGVLRAAARAALALPQGPASVEWPIDLQYAAQTIAPERPAVPEPGGTWRDAAPEAVRLLAAARRPVIWAGGGARAAGPELRALAERLGAPILTSNAGRGAVPEDHPLVVGNFATSPAAEPLLRDADLLLSIGTHFRSQETKHYKLRLPAEHVQIDVDPAAIGRAYPATLGLCGEASAVLRALVPSGTAVEDGWRDRAAETREAVRAKLRADIGPYAILNDAIRTHLDDASPIARDVTIPSSQWGNRLLPILDPATNVFPLGGGIGQGLAMGIGAATARPDVPTLVMAGDGGFSVHLGEIATLAQERPWLVVLLFNDGGYGVLRNMQDRHMDRRSGVDLFTPDFAAVAAAASMPYARVRDAAEFGEAFAKAVAAREPYFLEVDVTAIGPTPASFVPPVPVPTAR